MTTLMSSSTLSENNPDLRRLDEIRAFPGESQVECSSGVKVWRCVVVWAGVCWELWVSVSLSVPCVAFPVHVLWPFWVSALRVIV